MMEEQQRTKPHGGGGRPRGSERLAAMARVASRSLDVDTTAEACLDVLLEFDDVDAATLLMADPQTGEVLPLPSRGVRRAETVLDDAIDTLDLERRCLAAAAAVTADRGDRIHACHPLRGAHPHDGRPVVLAVLHLVSRPGCTLADGDLESALELFGQALQSALRLQYVEQQNRILRGLNEIADLFNQSPRLQETLGLTLSRVLALMRAEIGSIFLRHASGPGLTLDAHQGPPGVFVSEDSVVAPGRGEVGEVVQTGRLKIWCPLGDPHARVSLCVPLRSKGQVLGAFKITSTSRASFSEEEIEFAERLAGQMGLAIENGQQFQTISEQAIRLSRRTGHLSTLLEMSDQMASALELEGNVEACVQRLADVVAVPLVIVLHDEGGGQARILGRFVDRMGARRGRRMSVGLRFPWADLPTAWQALQNLRLVIVDEGQEGMGPGENRWMLANDVRSALVLPLVANGVALGALVLASTSNPRVFYPSELDFARTVANQLALAIERDRLFREVRDAARMFEQRVEDRTRALLETNLRLQEATRQRADFLKVMSHELRTPLNAILGFSEVLSDGDTEVTMDEVREYSAAIHDSGRSLLALINDILDLANPQSSREGIHREQIQIGGVVAGILDLMRPLALGRSVMLQNRVDGTNPPLITDRSRLKQILYNLVSNAVKFSPPQGTVTIDARTDGAAMWLTVTDEGPGIPPALHEKVFEPFFQAEGGLGRSFDGAGLGLSLARRYVALLGGEMRLQSEVGVGSRFQFSLPLEAGSQ